MKFSMTGQEKGDLLKEVQFKWNFLTGQVKGDF
jgi:hypothetical protein